MEGERGRDGGKTREEVEGERRRRRRWVKTREEVERREGGRRGGEGMKVVC